MEEADEDFASMYTGLSSSADIVLTPEDHRGLVQLYSNVQNGSRVSCYPRPSWS